MNEERAREVLAPVIRDRNMLWGCIGGSAFAVYWKTEDERLEINGLFTAEQLRALAWWMKNKTTRPYEQNANAEQEAKALERCRKIFEERCNAVSWATIAGAYHISRDNARNIYKRAAALHQQGKLFPKTEPATV